MRLIITSQVSLDNIDTRGNHVLGLFENISKISETYLFVPNVKRNKLDLPNIKYVPYLNLPIIKIISYEINLFIMALVFCWKNRADIIYNRQSPCTFSPLVLAKIINVPFFVEVNGSLLAEGQVNDKSRLLTIVKLSERINYKYANKIIAVSKGIKEDIVRLYNINNNKVFVLQNGTDIDLFRPIDKKNLNIVFDNTYKYIGFIGSFAPWHGLEHLIESAPIVIKECKNVKYVLVGDGPLKEKFAKRIKELHLENHFILTGRVSHHEVPKYINLFDICVILKSKEIPGSPLKLFEYLACGKPVVATNSPDFDILNVFESGILVNPCDSKDVSSAIITLFKDKNLREKMGYNARKYAVEKGSWMHVATEVNDLISCVIENS